MELSELAIIFGIFILIFTLGSMFVSSFGSSVSLPTEISSAWNSTYGQIQSAGQSVSANVATIQGGGISAVAGVFGLAFSGIFYIAATLWSFFVTIPTAVGGAINYLFGAFGLPPVIPAIIIAMLFIVVILKTISFVTGRPI
jgi:hypothetical protein